MKAKYIINVNSIYLWIHYRSARKCSQKQFTEWSSTLELYFSIKTAMFLLNVYTSSEEFLEKLLRLDRTDSDRNRSSSSFVSAVPTQKTRRVLSRPVIFRLSEFRNELEGSDFEVGEDTISASKSFCREMNQSFVPSYSYFPIFCLR